MISSGYLFPSSVLLSHSGFVLLYGRCLPLGLYLVALCLLWSSEWLVAVVGFLLKNLGLSIGSGIYLLGSGIFTFEKPLI